MKGLFVDRSPANIESSPVSISFSGIFDWLLSLPSLTYVDRLMLVPLTTHFRPSLPRDKRYASEAVE